MKHFIGGIKKYADFTGRARREEFWMYTLIYFVFNIVIGTYEYVSGSSWLGFVFAIFMFLPSIAMGARRLHDTGRTGWWQLIGIIPLIGLIVLIIFYCQDSHDDNDYGPNPKALDK
ncbi:DUF805 domain-containing protein [Shewanella sp. OPT22]|nr:DUF805 domain-containing protein [Shewanella sp. OPT22]